MILCLLLFWFQTARSPAQEHARRGFELFQKGELKPAEAELREATRLSPNDAISLALLGGVLARLNRLKEARFYLEKAVAIDPADSGTRYNLAAVEFGSRRLVQTSLIHIKHIAPVMVLGSDIPNHRVPEDFLISRRYPVRGRDLKERHLALRRRHASDCCGKSTASTPRDWPLARKYDES